MKREEIKLGMILTGNNESRNLNCKFVNGRKYKVIGLYLPDEGITSVCKVKSLGDGTGDKYLLPTELTWVKEHKVKKLYAYSVDKTTEVTFFTIDNKKEVLGYRIERTPEFDIEYN